MPPIELSILIGGIVLGLILLVGGADLLVRGAVVLAQRAGLSTVVIGVSVVAFGTSLPELVVSLRAALTGAPGLAVGNVVGSNIANIFLILGVAGLISPVPCDRTTLWRDTTAMIVGTLLFAAAALAGPLDARHGLAALLLLGLYLCWALRRDPAVLREAAEDAPTGLATPWLLLLLLGGVIGVGLGSRLLVDNAVALADALGVSDTVIGLTLVAFGTSVPELATVVVAALRRQAGVALGNVLGSNLFNLLGIMGVTSLLVPIAVPASILAFDLWVMVAAALILLPALATDRCLSRREAAAFFLAYFAFLGAQVLGVGERLAGIVAG